jgi:hypothetical protein
MIYKLKWRTNGAGPLSPEPFDHQNQAKDRARALMKQHGSAVSIDVWNDDETWQIVTPSGVADWCKED